MDNLRIPNSILEEPEDLNEFKENSLKFILNASTLKSLKIISDKLVGRNGFIKLLIKSLPNFSEKERRKKGIIYNSILKEIEKALKNSEKKIIDFLIDTKLKNKIDITIPTRSLPKGFIHPVSKTIFDIIRILKKMGFWLVSGPDIESDFNNFSALNIPENHPSRQKKDTFYFPEFPDGIKRVLRTHISPIQIHTMLNKLPPIRTMAIGRAYRVDYDRTHTPCFHQVEVLLIDKDINMGHLRQCIDDFCFEIFKKKMSIRFRPAFFPFTRPSAEIDVAYEILGNNLIVDSGSKWLEIIGCGMVHSKILDRYGINSKIYKGFAFGAGIERITMLKYGISDLREFYSGNIPWLKHYGISLANSICADF